MTDSGRQSGRWTGVAGGIAFVEAAARGCGSEGGPDDKSATNEGPGSCYLLGVPKVTEEKACSKIEQEEAQFCARNTALPDGQRPNASLGCVEQAVFKTNIVSSSSSQERP